MFSHEKPIGVAITFYVEGWCNQIPKHTLWIANTFMCLQFRQLQVLVFVGVESMVYICDSLLTEQLYLPMESQLFMFFVCYLNQTSSVFLY